MQIPVFWNLYTGEKVNEAGNLRQPDTVSKEDEGTKHMVANKRNDPSVLCPMRQCALGEDKMRKLTIFEDWLEEADSRMEYIGITDDKEKIIPLRTWAARTLKN